MEHELDRIVEISVAKMDSSRTRKQSSLYKTSSKLHRDLMVSSVLKALKTDKYEDSLMAYREPKIIDFDMEDSVSFQKSRSVKTNSRSPHSLSSKQKDLGPHITKPRDSSLVSSMPNLVTGGKPVSNHCNKDVKMENSCTIDLTRPLKRSRTGEEPSKFYTVENKVQIPQITADERGIHNRGKLSSCVKRPNDSSVGDHCKPQKRSRRHCITSITSTGRDSNSDVSEMKWEPSISALACLFQDSFNDLIPEDEGNCPSSSFRFQPTPSLPCVEVMAC